MDSKDRYSKQIEMENISPPPAPTPGPNDPKPASNEDLDALNIDLLVKSIAGAAAQFRKACEGGDSYDNNCAHFLSDAFIRAGYTELSSPATCINARCGTLAKRPIRAREMWCWFQFMANETRDVLPKNEGLWAVFQLNEDQYWGGHVVIIDTDKNVYYGTGNYPTWSQHCFKW